jgi:hypothetical protein
MCLAACAPAQRGASRKVIDIEEIHDMLSSPLSYCLVCCRGHQESNTELAAHRRDAVAEQSLITNLLATSLAENRRPGICIQLIRVELHEDGWALDQATAFPGEMPEQMACVPDGA